MISLKEARSLSRLRGKIHFLRQNMPQACGSLTSKLLYRQCQGLRRVAELRTLPGLWAKLVAGLQGTGRQQSSCAILAKLSVRGIRNWLWSNSPHALWLRACTLKRHHSLWGVADNVDLIGRCPRPFDESMLDLVKSDARSPEIDYDLSRL